ncbi:MAG TPA: ATP-binding protein [Flavilitoribacter sp.]|nr:ATP-binding protein [Flavilitoribacter sp.]
MRKFTLYQLLIFLWGIHPSIAQQLRFERYTMEDGLSNPGTYWLKSLIQDREGFLWFTTFNGLNRFDGKNFKVFQYNDQLPKSLGDNLTTGICEADDGRIWVGTASGIYIFDPVTETFDCIEPEPDEPGGLCGRQINFIGKDHEGNMWVGTGSNGVCRWSPKSGTFTGFGNYFKDGLVFYQQKDGTIWVGNIDGLHRKLPGKDSFQLVRLTASTLNGRPLPASDIAELPDGQLFIASSGYGLWKYAPATGRFEDLTASFSPEFSTSLRCLVTDKAGRIWMGATREIQRYDPVTGLFHAFRFDEDDPAGVPSFPIAAGYADAAGSLWFSTSTGGVIVTHTSDNPIEILGDMIIYEAVRLDENRLLINDGEKIWTLDCKAKQLLPSGIPPEISTDPIRDIALSGQNELWTLNNRDQIIKVYNFQTGKIRSLPGGSTLLKTDRKGRIWSGLKYFDEDQGGWIRFYPKIAGFPDSTKVEGAVLDLYFDDKNTAWLATNLGIFRYDPDKDRGRRYTLYPGAGQASERVQLIFPGSGGRFYLSTTNGLSIYDPVADRFRNYNQNNGLLHNQVTTVVEDIHGHLWISSPKGLQKFLPETGQFITYGINDGFPDPLFYFQRAYSDQAGYLYFTSGEKLIRFHPDSLKEKDYAPSVRLLDFYLDHKVVRVGVPDSLLKKQLHFSNGIRLRHDQSDFGFSFVMPVFFKSEGVEYFYQLTPYQTDWRSAGNRTEIHYSNIDPGRYTFRVKARTADGYWSAKEATFGLYIAPPWWATPGAYFGYLLLVSGAALAIYRFNLNRQLERAQARHLRELDTLRSRLYANITHEFRTPLTVIMGMAGNLKGQELEKKLILRNSNSLLRLINQLLDLSKLDAGKLNLHLIRANIVSYLKYLTESFYSLTEEKQIDLSFQSGEETLIMDFDEEKIQHIVFNLLSNAVKFTPPGGEISIRLRKTDEGRPSCLQMEVLDTGIGVSPENLPHVFDRFFQADDSPVRRSGGTGIGLALSKELVELMGGNISIQSELNNGTCVTLRLPVNQEAPMAHWEAQVISYAPPTEEIRAGHPTEEAGLPDNRPLLLIIEDNRDVVLYLESILTDNYRILTEADGQSGMDKAFETVPDIILSDVMMPEKDGFEVCRILKSDQRTSHIPIVLLTARAEQRDKVSGLKFGADAYLQKPFDKEELFVRLEKLVESQKRLQEKYLRQGLSGFDMQPGDDLDAQFLHKIREVIREKIGIEDLSPGDLGKALYLSQMQLYRKLKALTGKTPTLFIRTVRLQNAAQLLKTTDLNVSEVAYESGFSDPAYFSRVFKDEFGITPSSFRN